MHLTSGFVVFDVDAGGAEAVDPVRRVEVEDIEGPAEDDDRPQPGGVGVDRMRRLSKPSSPSQRRV